ncbi:MAG TPA: PEP-CTERM sorting domain-containing protein [Roseimicrobium sp.]|nr:PEP-CTERM sorting domain-containing protein [Roseimicrobium sp.]
MKLYSCLLLALTAAAVSTPLNAATVTFDSASDLSTNFTAASNTGTAVAWNAGNGGTAVKYDTGISALIFNSAAASTSYTIKADVNFLPNGGAYTSGGSGFGLGFFTNIGTNNGYAALLRFTGTNTADFRLFEGANASTGSLGTQINEATSTFTLASGTWSTSGFYTLSLDVVNNGTSISFTGSVLTTGGTSLGTFATYLDTTPSSVANTSVGLRFGVGAFDRLALDNFTLPTSAIPEPSTYALLGGAGVLGLALLTRRQRR